MDLISNWLPFLLLINSLLTIAFILNQNESSKDSATSQIGNSSWNIIEYLTWFSLILQFILLLIKTKITI